MIGGITSLFYKMGRRASLLAENGRGGLADSPLAFVQGLGRKLISPMTASARGPSALNQAMLGLIQQGRVLFFEETFDGNGRTCSTCHRADNNLTIDPAFIATLPANDPLFVAEFNPVLAKLESPTLMRLRGVILENKDGFDKPGVFRAPPPMINTALTGPYALSGEVPTVSQVTIGATKQHFTKNIGGDPDNIPRVTGVDFRLATQEELDAMEAFQLSTFVPQRQDFDLNRFLTTDAQRRGRELFFGAAKCSQCHGGTVLSDATDALVAALGEPRGGGKNLSFNTGVVNLPINFGDNGGFGPLPKIGVGEPENTRKFSTPSLFNVRNTAPFFHDNSVATLREAVAFYDSVQFNQSPSVGPVDLGGPHRPHQRPDRRHRRFSRGPGGPPEGGGYTACRLPIWHPGGRLLLGGGPGGAQGAAGQRGRGAHQL